MSNKHYVTIFRSRLRPDIYAEYSAMSARMRELAQSMPGFISIESYEDDAGARVSIVEFASHEEAAAWRSQPERLEAQRVGREQFYEEYRVQVCTLDREYAFAREG